MRRIAIGALLALGGCAAQVSQDDLVPIRQLVADVAAAGTPYECAEFDPATQSCETISTMRIEGDTLINEGRFLIAEEQEPPATGIVRFAIEGDHACGNLGEVEMSGFGGGEFEAFIVNFLKAALSEVGEVCVSYYSLGGNRYLSEARLRSGELLPDGRQEVRFLPRPINLRVAE